MNPIDQLLADPAAKDFKRLAESDLDWSIVSGIVWQAARTLGTLVQTGYDVRTDLSNEGVPWNDPRLSTPGNAIRISIPFLLLAGLAIEGQLKALRIAQLKQAGEDIVRFKKKGKTQQLSLRADLTTHNLVVLAEACGLTLSGDEEALLERLHKYVTWAGKYPIALVPEENDHPDFGPADIAMPLALYQRVAKAHQALWQRNTAEP